MHLFKEKIMISQHSFLPVFASPTVVFETKYEINIVFVRFSLFQLDDGLIMGLDCLLVLARPTVSGWDP